MSFARILFCTSFILCVLNGITGLKEIGHPSAHRIRTHQPSRRHRSTNDGALRFEPEPYSKKLELNSSGKIHCKVAGGVAPVVQWFLNDQDPLPPGVTSTNGTLLVAEASRLHSGQYTCHAKDGDHVITAKIHLDVVVAPRILEPEEDQLMHVLNGTDVWLHCRALGEPVPTTHWDRNRTQLSPQQEGVAIEGSPEAAEARIVLMTNGSLYLRNAAVSASDRYGCTAGSAAGLARNELTLRVHPEGEMPPQESTGVAGKAVLVSVSVAGAYMVLVLALMVYCRRRRLKRRQRGEKMELEMTEGREKLVEDGEEDKQKVGNGVPLQNGRLLPHEKDSGADNSESCVSRASKKSGQYDHLTVPRSLLLEKVILGRGEFGDVHLAKIDIQQVKKLRNKDNNSSEPDLRHILVKSLATKDEVQLAEFRRQLELFSRVRHENIARLIGLCNEMDPHYMLLEHTDWGDLKQFLVCTRLESERAEYEQRVGATALAGCDQPTRSVPPLQTAHAVLLATHLARANSALAHRRMTHRDIAARNCIISSQLHLKLSLPALTRGPHSHEYFKMHDQVIPLRWLPGEAVMEGDYSTKSDVYMFAATVWEIYTKAELPFAKLNDNSVMERIKSGTLEWPVPECMPERMAALLRQCWSKSPADRPLFDAICEELNSILQDLTSENVSMKSQEKIEEGAEEC